ncbi:hypothetical protein BZG36_04777 [Bifiguratus adelaidae]|uniref:SH3 domain-containing protein n=1 Tax=Bifiguratus adelaidae TaxID=1938954 RepID=A0A261XWD0_9FUNG|nr:hypothetical protein BZG36_04777 [Bifiguratus adelaidae]
MTADHTTGPGATLVHLTNTSASVFATTNPGGLLLSTCHLAQNNSLIIAGDFNVINGTQAYSIARYDIASGQIENLLGGGIQGIIHQIWCSSSLNMFVAGGQFNASTLSPITTLRNAAYYLNETWHALPWGGFESIVYSVVGSENGRNATIYFGTGQNFTANVTTITNATSTMVPSASSTISASASASAFVSTASTLPITSTSGSSAAFTDQNTPSATQTENPSSSSPSIPNGHSIPLNNPNMVISGGNSLREPVPGTEPSMGNPHNVVHDCSSSEAHEPWLMEPGLPGWWQVSSEHKTHITGIRIKNPGLVNGKHWGVKTFGLLALPEDAYLPLRSSCEPHTLCTTNCRLNDDQNWSSFEIDYNAIQPPSLREEILDKDGGWGIQGVQIVVPMDGWYGEGGGLAGVEIYSSDANVAQCPSVSTGAHKRSLITGVPSLYGLATTSVTNGTTLSATKSDIVQWNVSLSSSSPLMSAWNGLSVTTALATVFNNASNPLVAMHNLVDDPASNQLYAVARIGNQSQRDVLLSFEGGSTNAVVCGYVDGSIEGMDVLDSVLYVGGAFNQTFSVNGSATSARNVAKWTGNGWTPLLGGVDQPVEFLQAHVDTRIVSLSGPFTAALPMEGAIGQRQLASAGYVEYSSTQNAWSTNGTFIVGQVSTSLSFTNDAGSDMYLGGSIVKASVLQSPGIAYVQNSGSHIMAGSSGLWPQSFSASNAFEINAGAHWSSPNASVTLTVLGGDFDLGNGLKNVAVVYDNGSVSVLSSTFAIGPVQVLDVAGNWLVMGGANVEGGVQVWDLSANQSVDVGKLQAENGFSPNVTSIVHTADNQTVYVAGDFISTTKPAVTCAFVCKLSTSTSGWSSPANANTTSLQGAVSTMELVDGMLWVGGTLSVNGMSGNIAQLNTSSNDPQWVLVDTHGVQAALLKLDTVSSSSTTISAIYRDRNNANRVYVAGKNATTAFISVWDGTNYHVLANNLPLSNNITSVSTVPSSNNNGMLGNALLLVMGSLDLPQYGPMSTAFYDGQQWYPWLVGTTATGASANIRGYIPSANTTNGQSSSQGSSAQRELSVPAVILISIAVALGLVFAIMAIAVLVLCIKRRKTEDRPIKHYNAPSDTFENIRRPESWNALLMVAGLLGTTDDTHVHADYHAESEDEQNLLQRPSAEMTALHDDDTLTRHLLSASPSGPPPPPPPPEDSTEADLSDYHLSSDESRRFSGAANYRSDSDTLDPASREAANRNTQYSSNSSQPSSHNRDTGDFSSFLHPDGPRHGHSPFRDSAASSDNVSFNTLVALAQQHQDHTGLVSEQHPRLYEAQFAFTPREEGEIELRQGDQVVVVDTRDKDWWIGWIQRDDRPVQGVFPAAFVKRT